MDSPCCVGVVRDSSGLVGKEVTIGKSQKAYYSTPKTKSGHRMGVVVVHDIFGFELPNCKYIVDYLASKGFDAIMPDFYGGKNDVGGPWPATETEVTKELGGEDFMKWFGEITSEKFQENFKSEVDDATAYLRRKGCSRYAIIGFCWGGLAAENAAKGGRFSAMVSAHGCAHSGESFKAVKGKSLYLTVPDDAFFAKSAQDEITAAGGKVKVFEGMTHGFIVRGDFQDAKVKAASDEALEDAVALFKQSLLKKPAMTTIGSLQPNGRGLTFMAKILGEPTEVEETRKAGGSTKFYEVLCGDSTGQVVLSLKDFQKDGMEKDKVLCIRNASVRMVKGYIRIVVDKWGKLDFDAGGEIKEVGSRNMSATEYELVGA